MSTQHAKPLVLSIVIHLLIVVILFFLYITIQKTCKQNDHRESKKVCINLATLIPNNTIVKQSPSLEHTAVERKKDTLQKHSLEKIPKPVRKKIKTKKVYKKKLHKKKLHKKKIATVVQKQKKDQPKYDLKPKQVDHDKKVALPSDVPPSQITSKAVQKTVLKTVPHYTENMYKKKYLAQLYTMVKNNLYYPRKARKRGLQGDVIVRFLLKKNGEISRIEVVRSSYQILSRSAVKTLHSLDKKLPKPQEDITIKLPITYSLEGF